MMTNSIGQRFQEETKYRRNELGSRRPAVHRRPEPYKLYSSAARLALPQPQAPDAPSLWQALRARRSERSYGRVPLKKEELSSLAWAAQGVTERIQEYALRTAPSAGALFPVETYLSVQNVETVPPGIYHFDPRGHALELIKAGAWGREVAAAALDQEFIAAAAVVFIWTAVFERSAWKYAERAYRYVYLDAGHIAQNVALAAVALGLGSCQVGALYDDEVNALLEVDGRAESVVYMTSVGRLKG